MRIVGHLVVKNESGRYLERCITWLNNFVDTVCVMDDCSTDDTVQVATLAGAIVGQRYGVTAPGFLLHESGFREYAWQWMEVAGYVDVGDWVLCVDADEFLVSSWLGDERAELEKLARAGRPVTFPVAEVFDVLDGVPQVRKDGYWPTIEARRFVPFLPRGTFHPRVEGGGSVPSYAQRDGVIAQELTLLHYGYATEEDRKMKYDRYRRGRGHSSRHIQSILARPRLEPWEGKVP